MLMLGPGQWSASRRVNKSTVLVMVVVMVVMVVTILVMLIRDEDDNHSMRVNDNP